MAQGLARRAQIVLAPADELENKAIVERVAPQDLARYPWINFDWPRGPWLSVELLGRLSDGLNRLLPVEIGRFQYRSDYVDRYSEEDLPPLRTLEQAVRDTALARN